MLRIHTVNRALATALLCGGLGAVGVALAGEAAATGPVGPFNWCPGQPLPKVDVIWNNSVCHSYYYVNPGQGNVGDGHGGGINNVWEGANPPVGPGPAAPSRTSGARGNPCPKTEPARTAYPIKSAGI